MLDLFLRAESRAAMWAAYHAAGLTVEIPAADAEGRATHVVEVPAAQEGGDPTYRHYVPHLSSHRWALDDGVAIVTTPAEIDPETGDVTTPAVLSTLWHANLRLLADVAPIKAALLEAGAEEVSPTTPQRVFG